MTCPLCKASITRFETVQIGGIAAQILKSNFICPTCKCLLDKQLITFVPVKHTKENPV